MEQKRDARHEGTNSKTRNMCVCSRLVNSALLACISMRGTAMSLSEEQGEQRQMFVCCMLACLSCAKNPLSMPSAASLPSSLLHASLPLLHLSSPRLIPHDAAAAEAADPFLLLLQLSPLPPLLCHRLQWCLVQMHAGRSLMLSLSIAYPRHQWHETVAVAAAGNQNAKRMLVRSLLLLPACMRTSVTEYVTTSERDSHARAAQ